MDIHKPKAAHSWREFLVEIGTIICGILIALSLEQVVEQVHWHHLAERTDDELRSGLQFDLVNAMERTAIYPCQRIRLSELSSQLKKGGQTWKALPPISIPGYRGFDLVLGEAFHVPRPAWTDAPWQSAVTSGVINHMPHDRVSDFAHAYRLIDEFPGWQNDEVHLISRLAALTNDHKMSEVERLDALRDLAELDRVEQMTAVASGWVMSAAKDLGVRVPTKLLDSRLAVQRSFRGACVGVPTILMGDQAFRASKALHEDEPELGSQKTRRWSARHP